MSFAAAGRVPDYVISIRQFANQCGEQQRDGKSRDGYYNCPEEIVADSVNQRDFPQEESHYEDMAEINPESVTGYAEKV